MQEVNLSKKEQHLRSIAKQAIDAAIADRESVNRSITCWNMFNSDVSNSDKEYLNRYGDYYLPAKVPFNSIVKDNIEWIVSRYINRPFVFSVKTVDQRSLRRKKDEQIKAYFKAIDDKSKAVIDEIQAQMQLINAEKQRIQSVLQQQPENEEHAMQLQQLQQQMPVINAQFEKAIYLLNRELKLTEEERNKIDQNFKYSYQDLVEIKAKKLLLSEKELLKVDRENKKGFFEMNVTGAPYLYVDYDDKRKKLIYKSIPSYQVFTFGGSTDEFANEGDIQVITEVMSLGNLMEKYGEYLDEYTINKLKNMYSPGNMNSYSYDSYGDDYVYTGGYGSFKAENMPTVRRVFFKTSERKDYIVSPAKWNPEICYYKEKKEKDKPRKGQTETKKFINYTYEAVYIDDNICVYVKPRKEQDKAIRLFENPSYAELPIVGFNFNGIDKARNSLIWTTKDMQSLYNIIDFQIEYMIAVSGTRTLLMDKGQIPDMDPEEWQHEKKLGVAWVDTVKKSLGIQGRKSNFNQWNVMDLSISNSVQFLEQIKQNLKITVDNLSGVSRQARGDMSQYDGAKTSELAIESSSIITDIIYWKYDNLVSRALLRLLRLAAKTKGKKKNIIQYTDDDGILNVDEIPANLVNIADLDILIEDNNEEMRKIENISKLAVNHMQTGQLNVNDLVRVLNAKTVNEMEKKLDYYAQRAIELRQQEQQNAISAQQETEQMKAEIEKELKERELQIKEFAAQVEKMKVESEASNKEIQNQIEHKKNEDSNYTKLLDIFTEREVELSYLDEQTRSSMINETLQAAKMAVDRALGEEKIQADLKKNTQNRAKEHIKDN